MLEKGTVTGEFLSCGESPEIDRIRARLAGSVGDPSLKTLEAAFECFLDGERRRLQGAVYTPEFVVEYLIRHGFAVGRRNHGRPPRVCDPACGSGGFLLKAAQILREEHGISPEESFRDGLFGFDSDPWALRHAQCLIELYLASCGCSLPAGDTGLFCRDTLLAAPRELLDLCGVSTGFDLIATNPPYVKFQNLAPAYRASLQARFGRFARRNFSLSPLFLIAAFECLSPEGCLAVITQNNLHTSLAGEEVRRYLQEQRCIRRIVDFGHHRVFQRASAYTCLIFISREPSSTLEYTCLEREADPEILERARFFPVRHEDLQPRKWRFAERKHLENLGRIERCGIPLGRIASIRVGFATLKDSVFLVKESDGRCKASPRPGSEFYVESGITREAVKVPDLNGCGIVEENIRRVIFPYRLEEGRYRLIPEDELKRMFPDAYAYLCACRGLLEKRDRGRKRYPAWYAWGRTQGMDAPGPKLLTRTFSTRPRFIPDESNRLFCNGYSVSVRTPSEPEGGFSLPVLERILNGPVMHYYAKLTSFRIGGNYQCYQKNFIERFGIPDLTRDEAGELLRLQGEELDAFVARLYGLTPADLREILD